jgi:hypothetical protein
MEPLIARGFVTLMLTNTRIAQIKAIENTFPLGRYLQAFEILKYYGLEGEEVTEQREAVMKQLLSKWYAGNNDGTIHNWMDYVNKHWHEPQPSLKHRVSDKFESIGAALMVLAFLK